MAQDASSILIAIRTRYFHSLALSLAFLFLTIGPFSSGALAFDGDAPAGLQCEGMTEPIGIDIAHPLLSWQLRDSRRGARQTAYEIRVGSSAEALAQDHADVWDSGRVDSDQSVNVLYGGPAVESRRRYYWQVRVWDAQGQPSSYSQPSWWEMGLLSPQDWKAKWITRDMPVERGDYESAPKWIWAANDNALTNATPGKHEFRFASVLRRKPKAPRFLLPRKTIWRPGSTASRWWSSRRWAIWTGARSLGIFPRGSRRQTAECRRQFGGRRGNCAKGSRPPVRKPVSSRFSGSKWPDGKIRTLHLRTGMEGRGRSKLERLGGHGFDDSSWPSAAVVAEIGQGPLGTPWPAQPVNLLRKI